MRRFSRQAADIVGADHPLAAEKLRRASPQGMRYMHGTLACGTEPTIVRDNLRHSSLATISICVRSDEVKRAHMQRKTWPVATIAVEVSLHADHDGTQYIRRGVTVDGPLEEAQRARLVEICEKTPVTLFIKRGTRIDTTLRIT